MTRAENLPRLQELFAAPEVKTGFPSQQACLSWANKVAPLLRFSDRYHSTFVQGLQIISTNVSIHTLEPAFRSMLNQIEMAMKN